MSTDFTLDLSKFKTKVGVRTDAVLRRVAFEAFSSVIRKTPVDTGRARANWIPMIGELPSGQIGMAANGHSLAAASAVVKKFTAIPI